MPIAQGSRHSIGFVKETTYGTTPASPVFKALRHNSTSLGLSKSAILSDELRADRQISDLRHGNKSVAGDIVSHLSYADFDDILEAALGGTWTANVLKAGTTRRSYTIERKFGDISEFHRYTGCEVNSLAIEVAPDAIVNMTAGWIGKGLSIGTAILSGATYPAATTNSPFDSFTGTISEGGTASGVVTSLSLNIANNLSTQFAIGSDETLQPSIGRSNVTGSVSVYFENKTLLEKFLNETESSIVFTLVDVAGNQYAVSLPRVKYNSGQPDVGGEGSVTLSMDFQALLHSGTGTNIQITRTPA